MALVPLDPVKVTNGGVSQIPDKPLPHPKYVAVGMGLTVNWISIE
jgi:hypothetical protein